MPTPHKVLIFDVETAPSLAFMWRPNDQWIPKDRLVEQWFMLTWAAKWEHQKTVKGKALSETEVLHQDDTELVDGLARLIDQADAIVAHNADRFDVPVLNSRLLKRGLDPIPPVTVIDTLKMAKKAFRLEYNNLDYLATFLGLEGKQKVDFDLWRDVYLGSRKAIRQMLSYNRQDVRALEQVYQKLKPYVRGVPRLVTADYDGQPVCPFCGEEALQRRGFHRTAASTFQRWQCQACRRWSRSRAGEKEQRPATVALR